jgi:hypothetical protein
MRINLEKAVYDEMLFSPRGEVSTEPYSNRIETYILTFVVEIEKHHLWLCGPQDHITELGRGC